MPANPYQIAAIDLTAESNLILVAFTDAQAELNSQGAPEAVFLEIGYVGGKIIRNWDNAQVNSLSAAEQFRLYPQLGGLFNLAMRKLLYP